MPCNHADSPREGHRRPCGPSTVSIGAWPPQGWLPTPIVPRPAIGHTSFLLAPASAPVATHESGPLLGSCTTTVSGLGNLVPCRVHNRDHYGARTTRGGNQGQVLGTQSASRACPQACKTTHWPARRSLARCYFRVAVNCEDDSKGRFGVKWCVPYLWSTSGRCGLGARHMSSLLWVCSMTRLFAKLRLAHICGPKRQVGRNHR